MMLHFPVFTLLCYGIISAEMAVAVTMDCPLQNWNIYDYAQYYCTVNNTFLRFRVVGLNESNETMIFSKNYNPGRTLTSGKFSSTLLTNANVLTAVITFSATINNSQVICDDFETTKICNVIIEGAPFKTIITGVHFNIDNNGTRKVKINWFPLSGAFRISHYIVKTSDNRIFNVGTNSDTSIDIGDFAKEDIEHNATVTGVDIVGNIGEESDPVFFTLDKPLNNAESVAIRSFLYDAFFFAIIFWQHDNSTRPLIQFYEICYTINNKSVCIVTNDLFIVINETNFSGENFSFTLIANNLYGNTTLYNNFITVSDLHGKCLANNNCVDTATFLLPYSLASLYDSNDITLTSVNDIMSTSPERTIGQLDLSTTAISNLDDSYCLQYSCHLCTMSTSTTTQECDNKLQSWYIVGPISVILIAVIAVLFITCITCIITRKKAGKTKGNFQEKLNTVDLPLTGQQAIKLQKYEPKNELKMM